MKKFLKGYTICGEMHRRGWITAEDLAKDNKLLTRKLSVKTKIVYKLTIIPLVIGMKLSDEFARVVGEIVGSGWFKKHLDIDVNLPPDYKKITAEMIELHKKTLDELHKNGD